MSTYEIEFHKVSSLPLNSKNYRGHVFFNDATNEPIIETTTDEEGNVVKRLQHERGIYLCAYDNEGNLDYIPYTVAGAGGDNIGMDVDTLNDRITIWASKFQNDIQKLAKLTVDPDQILAQVKEFHNELNELDGKVADLRLKSDQIKLDVKEYVDGVEKQYSQFTIEADKINSKVEDLKEGYSMIEQTAKGITTQVENLEHEWSQVEQTATELKSAVHSDINKLESRISQTAGQISLEVEDKINNVNSRIEQLPNQIKMEVSDEFDSASIITRINDGDSEVKIHADKIILDGAAIANSLMIDGGQEVNDLFDKYKDNITSDLQTSIDELKMQVDGTIDNWYYSHYPVGWSADSSKHASNTISYNTENNIPQDKIEIALKLSTTPKADVEPYASWIKGIEDGKDDRPVHIGDTFTNTNFQQEYDDVRDGRTWKFCATVDSDGNYTDYRWEPMSDSASAAMKSITDLENRVSNKRQVFIEQPTVPYDKGDLWVIMESTDGNTSAKNIYVCITPKTNIDVDTFSEADWISTNNFIGKDIFDTKIDEIKSELVDQINTEVSKVDLRDVIVKTGLIEFKDGSYVPVNGLISKATDANGVETLTMRVDGEDITWQITQGVDEKGNAYLVANKPWGDPSDPAKSSFIVDQNGLLTAHNAVIYGKIYAGAGEIGGIDIHDNSISSSNGNFSVTADGVLTATNANITGSITATSLSIGSNVEIPQDNVKGLTNTLTNLQNQISDITGGSGGSTTSDWLTKAFSQTSINGGLLLSGNIFVADNNKKITAGMMGASATDTSKTPRFFAGNSNISSSDNDLSSDKIYRNNYPFIVTADGHLYAKDAELTGSLKINRRIGDEDKTFDIGDYVIGQMTGDGTFDMSGTVSGAIDSLNTEVYGPEMTPDEKFAFEMIQKDSSDQIIEESLRQQFIQTINAYRTRVSNSNTLLGRILRMEGKIAALQNDITALQKGSTGGSSSTVNKVTFSCSTCGARFIKNKTDKTNSNESNPDETYGDVKCITCSTCGSLAHKGLAAADDQGDSGNTGKNVSDIETTVNRKPSLPAFKEVRPSGDSTRPSGDSTRP